MISEGVLISQAVTTQALFFLSEIHSIELPSFSTTNHLRLSIISRALSLIHGIVEYS